MLSPLLIFKISVNLFRVHWYPEQENKRAYSGSQLADYDSDKRKEDIFWAGRPV